MTFPNYRFGGNRIVQIIDLPAWNAKKSRIKNVLTNNVIYRLTKALHDLQGKPLSESELGDKVKSIFNQCDLNKDGKISQDEFLKAGVAISEMFELEGDD